MTSVARWGQKKDDLMARRRQLHEGKAKILYEGPEPGTLVQSLKDGATRSTPRKGVIAGKAF